MKGEADRENLQNNIRQEPTAIHTQHHIYTEIDASKLLFFLFNSIPNFRTAYIFLLHSFQSNRPHVYLLIIICIQNVKSFGTFSLEFRVDVNPFRLSSTWLPNWQKRSLTCFHLGFIKYEKKRKEWENEMRWQLLVAGVKCMNSAIKANIPRLIFINGTTRSLLSYFCV